MLYHAYQAHTDLLSPLRSCWRSTTAPLLWLADETRAARRACASWRRRWR